MNHFKRLTCILLWLLVAACGGKNDGASESFNNAAVDSYAGASTALLDSLAALYPNGKLPADRAAQSAKDLSENPAVLLLTSEASKQIRGQSTGAVMRPMALSADYKPVIRIQNHYCPVFSRWNTKYSIRDNSLREYSEWGDRQTGLIVA
jgi:hypothetical protein